MKGFSYLFYITLRETSRHVGPVFGDEGRIDASSLVCLLDNLELLPFSTYFSASYFQKKPLLQFNLQRSLIFKTHILKTEGELSTTYIFSSKSKPIIHAFVLNSVEKSNLL